MARPRLPPEKRSSGILQVPVTQAEKALFKERAVSAGLSLASYVRLAALGHRIRPTALNYGLVMALSRVSAEQTEMLGQIAGATEAQRRFLISEVVRLQRQLSELASRVRV